MLSAPLPDMAISNQSRTRKLLQTISQSKPNTLELYSSGLTVIERVSISVQRYDERPFMAMGHLK